MRKEQSDSWKSQYKIYAVWKVEHKGNKKKVYERLNRERKEEETFISYWNRSVLLLTV